jgi:hypothetical protein
MMNKKLLAIIIAVVVLIGAAAAWYFLKGKDSSSSSGTTTTTTTVSDVCKYNDKDLCKFVNSWKENKYMTMTSNSTVEGKTVVSTLKSILKSDSSQMTTTVDGKETANYISIGNTSYTLDYTDNTWYKYTGSSTASTEDDDFSFDTKAETTTDTTTYTKIGQEACGSLTCFKYQVIETGMEGKQYIFFDTKDYQLRKMIMESLDGTVSTSEFSYSKVTITAPTPTKDSAPSSFGLD